MILSSDCQSFSAAVLGRGVDASSPSEIRPPADPKGPPCTNLRYLFLVTDRKIFLRALLAPMCTNFEGGARAKKMRFFFVKNFPKNA